MTDALPADGPLREIFLRALRDFSDNCEAPQLTPACPFSLEVGGGIRGCGEECIEILSTYNAPPGLEDDNVGGGLRFVRRRPPRRRTGPDHGLRAFDAAEIRMSDEGRPVDMRQSVSLIAELRQLLFAVAVDDADKQSRLQRIEQVAAVLEDRGFPMAQLIAGGLGSSVALMLSVVLTLPDNFEDATLREAASHLRASWSAAGLRIDFESGVDGAPPNRVRLLEIHQHLQGWAVRAPLAELATWVPAEPIDGLAVDLDVNEEGAWLLDRFSSTYLDNWKVSSLHAEWEWISGRRPSPLPLAQMHERKVPPDQLAVRIADLAVEGQPEASSARERSFQELATDYLEQGHTWSAAALFDGALLFEPENATFHNNRGFCLIHDDPKEALVSLDRAAQLGYRPEGVNLANRALALMLAGRFAVALRLIEDGYEKAIDSEVGRVTLWDPTPNVHPKLLKAAELPDYFARLAMIVSEKVDDRDLADAWRPRLRETSES